MNRMIGACIAAALLLAAPFAANAIVSQANEVPFQNTAADLAADPTASPGELVIPNWLGTIDNRFLVTAVGPNHVLAAKHLPLPSGPNVVFNVGPNTGTYGTLSFIDDPNSDLRLWELDATLSDWSELYEQNDEIGKVVTVFGRGRPPGDIVELVVFPPSLQAIKGWKWGTGSVSEWTWGRNIISQTFGSPTNGPLLEILFDRFGGMPRECHASGDDSSGPWFVPDAGGIWKLAGLQSTVLGPYQLPGGGASFDAMILDYGGLILAGQPFPDVPQDFPSNAAGVRVSQRLSWLQPLLAEPDSDADGVPDSSDNCPFVANPGQEASVQAGLTGVGCACLCGDVNDSCTVGGIDVVDIRGQIVPYLGLQAGCHQLGFPDEQGMCGTPPLLEVRGCDADGSGTCSGIDAQVILFSIPQLVGTPVFPLSTGYDPQNCAEDSPDPSP